MRRASRSIAISGTMPDRPRRAGRGSAVPGEERADRAADLEFVARFHDLVQEGRDLAVVEQLDGQVDHVGAVGPSGGDDSEYARDAV